MYFYLAQGQNSNSILQPKKKKKNIQQSHYTNPFFTLIYFANHTLSIILINTFTKSTVNWNKLDVKPDIRLSRGLTNTFLAFWKNDWAIAFELESFFFFNKEYAQIVNGFHV